MTSKQTIRSRLLVTAAVVSVAGFAAGTASACDKHEQQNQAAVQTVASPGAENVRVYIDPVTKRIRAATPEERQIAAQEDAAAAKVRAARPSARTIRRADGAVGIIDPNGLVMESVVVQKNADGSVSYQFVDSDVSGLPQATPAAQLEEK